jgi:hypothetical protein
VPKQCSAELTRTCAHAYDGSVLRDLYAVWHLSRHPAHDLPYLYSCEEAHASP